MPSLDGLPTTVKRLLIAKLLARFPAMVKRFAPVLTAVIGNKVLTPPMPVIGASSRSLSIQRRRSIACDTTPVFVRASIVVQVTVPSVVVPPIVVVQAGSALPDVPAVVHLNCLP